MSKISLTPSKEKRNKILKALRKKDPNWKMNMLIVSIIEVLALIMLAFTAYHAITERLGLATISSMVLNVMLIIFALLLSLSIRKRTQYECAFPFSTMDEGKLIIEDDAVVYQFIDLGTKYYYPDMTKDNNYDDHCEYRINKNDIKEIKIDENNTCTIRGNGIVSMNNKTIERKVTIISFVLAFEQEGAVELIKEWSETLEQ